MTALRTAHQALSAFTKQNKLTVEEVDDLQEGWRDVLEQQEEVNTALAQELVAYMDEDEIEAEYQQMLQSETAEGKTENEEQPQNSAASAAGPHVVVTGNKAAPVLTTS